MDQEESRKRLGLNGDKVFLYVGRLESIKGVDLLVQTAAHLEITQGMRVLVVGGDDGQNQEVERLRQGAQAQHRGDAERGADRQQREGGPQPTASSTIGTPRIVTAVSRKPMPVWKASAEPRYIGSASSVIVVENCAESATTVAPQTSATIVISSADAGRKPITSAALPLPSIAAEVTSVRP